MFTFAASAYERVDDESGHMATGEEIDDEAWPPQQGAGAWADSCPVELNFEMKQLAVLVPPFLFVAAKPGTKFTYRKACCFARQSGTE